MVATGRRMALALVSVALVGCARGEPSAPSLRLSQERTTAPASAPLGPQARPAAVPPALVAEAIAPPLPVYGSPDALEPERLLPNPDPSYGPVVVLVEERTGDWLRVLLPVRPNGTTGWVRVADVQLRVLPYRVLVELGAHRLTVWSRDAVVHQETVAVGKQRTPTPVGRFYINQLVRPANPGGSYGPAILGLSGFSEVLDSFAGALPALAIHGTNRPQLLGADASSGCIRISNDGVTKLAGLLPLGVPVDVVA